MTTLADNTAPTSIRYFQDETAKLRNRTATILPEDEQVWFYHNIAQLIKSAKARGSNPENPLFTDDRSITGLNIKERFIAFRNPAKGVYRKRLLDMTTLMSDQDLERLWTTLEMMPEKKRAVFLDDIMSLMKQAYAWGEKCEPEKNFDNISSEISTW